jgi:hypothetical protein
LLLVEVVAVGILVLAVVLEAIELHLVLPLLLILNLQ